MKTVKTGATLGTRILVLSGLAAGDRVIVDSGAPAEGTKVTTKPYAPDAAGRGGH